MRYLDKTQAQIGDVVRLNSDELGKVVALFDEQKFEQELDSSAWSFLTEGFLISSEKYGLLHYTTLEDNDVIFVSRKAQVI